jgi:uncharacterized protein YjiS (DUF1127 family)
METAMTSDVDPFFSPRTIVRARKQQAAAFRRQLRIVIRKTLRGLHALKASTAQAWQSHRELELLMHADDRMLADIGLTRFDVVFAAQESRGLLGRRDALHAAGTRRDEAIAVSQARRGGLPRTEAPPLVPALPSVVETSNFR